MQHENVIAYDLRQLKKHEQNYLRHNLELVVVVFAYVYGGITDMELHVKFLQITRTCNIYSHRKT